MSIDFLMKLRNQKKQFTNTQFWYRITPGKDETEKVTRFRIAEPSTHDPIVHYAVHEGLDQINPETGHAPYPGLAFNNKEEVCLNLLAEQLLGPGNHDYCDVCRSASVFDSVMRDLRSASSAQGARAELKNRAQKYGTWFGLFKQRRFYAFVAYLRILPHMIAKAGGDAKAGRLAIDLKGQIVDPNTHQFANKAAPNFAVWADPLVPIRIGEFFTDLGDGKKKGGGNFFPLLFEKAKSKTDYEMELGRVVSDEEYLKECPPLRAEPWNLERGFDIELTVRGKNISISYDFRACQAEGLKGKEKAVLKHSCPDILTHIRPRGMDTLVAFEDPAWTDDFKTVLARLGKQPVGFPQDPAEVYKHYTLLKLAVGQYDRLGIFTSKPVLTRGGGSAVQVAGQAQGPANGSGGGGDSGLDTYGVDNLAKTSGEDAPVEDDIPF